MADRIELGGGGVQLRVEGLNTTLRQLQQAGASTEDMRGLMHQLGTIVVLAAQPRTRRQSGAMAGSIRAGRGRTKAVVRMGGARIPYAGVQHYGWPAHGIEPDLSLVEALQVTRPALLAALDNGLAEILADADLT